MLEFLLIGSYLVFTTQMQQCQKVKHREIMSFELILYLSMMGWITIIAQSLLMYVSHVIKIYQELEDE